MHEAKRRGVEAIVLAAEDTARFGGGMVLGGRAGLRDTSVGDTTRYVVTKAPCRVVLTAAPPSESRDGVGEDDVADPTSADGDGRVVPVS